MTTVADYIVASLRRHGTRAIFGVPGGGGNLDLIDAARRTGFPFVLTATETAAAIAALAQAEITRAPGACLTTLGPGATSVVNGIATAMLERAPLVAFTDSYAERVRGQFEHQRLDHGLLLSTVTKSSVTLEANRAVEQLLTALATAAAPPPGPVHIDCPADVLDAPAAGSDDFSSHSVDAGSDRLADLRRLVSGARKPLLLVGLGARTPDDVIAVRHLCETRHVPALVTYKAKGVVPDSHDWFGGVFTNGAIEKPLVGEADLLIGVGLDPVELLPRPWTYSAAIAYCGPWDVEPRHIPYATRIVDAVSAVLPQLDVPLSEWRQADVRRHALRQRAAIRLRTVDLSPDDAVEACAAAVPAGTRVTVDAGAHMFPATMLWPVLEPGGLLISNGLSTMGFALPAAIGAAALDRDRPVVAITGDGGLLMCAGELLTAAREQLRVIVVVFNDASLSLIDIKQQARRLPPAGVATGRVEWSRLAESVGVCGFAATSADEIEQAMQAAMRRHGPSLIDVRIDPSNYGDMLRVIRG